MVIGRGAGFMGVRRVQGLGQSGSCKCLQIYMGRYEGIYIYIYIMYTYMCIQISFEVKVFDIEVLGVGARGNR